MSRVAGGDAGVATALRGIRGTSAAYGAAYGILFLAIVLGPYRRGDAWAWTALLVGSGGIRLTWVERAEGWAVA